MWQRVLTIVVIVFIIIGGGYYAYQQLMPPPEAGEQGPVYSTKPVVKGDIAVGVEAVGPLNPTSGGGIQVPGYHGGGSSGSGISYVIEDVLVQEGDEVAKGQLLVRLGAPGLETQIKNLEKRLQEEKKEVADLLNVPIEQVDRLDASRGITITTPIGGRVSELTVKEGEELKLGQIVAKVVDDSRFRLVAKATQGEFQNIKVGQKVALNFPQYDGNIEAKIVDVNYEPIAEEVASLDDSVFSPYKNDEKYYAYLHWLTIEGENPGLVRTGMRVRVGLPLDPEAEFDNNLSIHWLRYYSEVEGYVNEDTVYNRAEAIVTKVYVKNGQMVQPGDSIISLAGDDARKTIDERLAKLRDLEEELQDLYDQYNNLDILAPMDGVVAYMNTDLGMTLGPGEWLGHLYNTADMRLWSNIDDIDVLLVQQGAPVEITVDALPGKTFDGEVNRVSTMGMDRDGMTRFEVDIKVMGSPELRPGMHAKAFIDAGSAENVLLIPLEAIFEEDGQSMVEVLEEDGFVKAVPVKLGLMNDRFAEVQEGLAEGELVITGSSADILPSQRIKGDNLLPTKPEEETGESKGKGENKE